MDIFQDIEETLSQLRNVVNGMKKDIKKIQDNQKTFDEEHIELNKKLVENKNKMDSIKLDNDLIKEKLYYINSYKKKRKQEIVKNINVEYLEKYLKY